MKSIKSRLLVSVVSLLISLLMLVGTTYAWMTDSVTSGTNRIVGGSLDVELYHNSGAVTATPDMKIGSDSKLFSKKFDSASGNETALWKAGVVTYENFLVSNDGTLPLQYRVDLDIFDRNAIIKDAEEKTVNYQLTDVIKYKIVPGGITDITKIDLTADGFESIEPTDPNHPNSKKLTDAKLDPAKTNTFAIVLYWPSDMNQESPHYDGLYNVQLADQLDKQHVVKDVDGNNKELNELFIEFGVNLNAFQLVQDIEAVD